MVLAGSSAKFLAPLIADPFRVFAHLRQQRGQTVKKYYDAKRQPENLKGLQDTHIISVMIDDLLSELELALASSILANPL